jgi:hypothetical protein
MPPSPADRSPHALAPASRRDFLLRAGAGFGALAYSALSAPAAAPPVPRNPLAARPPHFRARALSVIWLFADGGPSHIDLFDPKPVLAKLEGKPLPPSFERPTTAMGVTSGTPLLASRRKFKQHGRSGLWVSDWLPEVAGCADDLAVIRSCRADGQTHAAGVCQMNTGALLPGRPSLGAWALYGLGSVADNLPGFVVLAEASEEPPGGSRNWGPGFMPAAFQGTKFGPGKERVLYTGLPQGVSRARQRAKIDFINRSNRLRLEGRLETDPFEAQIAAYELAYRMQSSTPEVVDLARESAATQRLYGIDRPATEPNGRNCLLARRLVERGVRFVQVYLGAGSKWDAHRNLEENHAELCQASDRPVAGLLKDLKSRGLLDSTLVVWGGEFGRTPMSESGNGRDHNPYGFTVWMAGGGVKGGVTHGATDEVGLYAVEKSAHVRDLHATILHCLGLDHKGLTFRHNGRDERLTINGGNVIREILA